MKDKKKVVVEQPRVRKSTILVLYNGRIMTKDEAIENNDRDNKES